AAGEGESAGSRKVDVKENEVRPEDREVRLEVLRLPADAHDVSGRLQDGPDVSRLIGIVFDGEDPRRIGPPALQEMLEPPQERVRLERLLEESVGPAVDRVHAPRERRVSAKHQHGDPVPSGKAADPLDELVPGGPRQSRIDDRRIRQPAVELSDRLETICRGSRVETVAPGEKGN